MAIGHHIQDRGHVVEKKVNNKTGERELNQNFQNMDECTWWRWAAVLKRTMSACWVAPFAFASLCCHLTNILTLWLSALSRGADLRGWVAAEGLGQASAVRPRPPPGGASVPGGSHGGHHRPRAGRQVGTHRAQTHWRHGWDICRFSVALLCRQVELWSLFVSTETNQRAKLRLKTLWRAPKQQDSERGAVPISHSLNQAALTSSVEVYNVALFFSKAGCTVWMNNSPLNHGRFHTSGIYSASSWGNCSLWMWK